MRKAVVLKYHLNSVGATQVLLPVFAKELSVQNQRGEVVLWAESPVYGGGHNGATGYRDYFALMTGQAFDLPTEAQFIGTVQLGTHFVVHIYGCKR